MSAEHSADVPAQPAGSAAQFVKDRRTSLLGAVFLMAMSAVGPGFITQTATFTVQLGAAFGFGILLSIIIDFIVQLNVWRIVGVSGKTAGELANEAIPGTGYLLAVLVIFGGLVFNIGNIAGIGLGLNAAIGLNTKIGGLIGALLAIAIFLYKRAGKVMDRVVIGLAVVKVAIVLIVLFVVHPPIGHALTETVMPDNVNLASLTTIVGGTVGGYITYAGAHRLLDSGITGRENIKAVSQASFWGVTITGIIRYLLFLAILGVAASGVTIDLASQTANPAAQAFQVALGEWGFRIFGVIFWAAGTTSTIGAAYTSVSFFSVFSKKYLEPRRRNLTTVVFIAVSLIVYLLLGTAPAALLVFAGGFNGLILPIGLTLMIYIGFARRDLLDNYRYPKWLLVLGALVCAFTWWMGISSVKPIFALLGL
ncbi:NRAMP family divalent metal transporter [Pseudoclavibacter soli]|uniref:NRAMP family divalent metal transporter n=1 Tax=Pseudoclavibacter soli TaxID=452623 RepID=UPI000420B6F0|nr:NRAMP family divalent metal transporter [Pseudoclavibacter soli]